VSAGGPDPHRAQLPIGGRSSLPVEAKRKLSKPGYATIPIRTPAYALGPRLAQYLWRSAEADEKGVR
jgi:hypothetical protein